MIASSPTLPHLERSFLAWYFKRRQAVAATVLVPNHCISENNETPADCQFTEKFLQIFWNEQRFTGELKTVAGESLEILNPGIWNVEAGPDFRNAAIKLNSQLRQGDIEIHRSARDWQRHGHDRDPAYDQVILHVVWDAAAELAAPPALPCFVIAPFLNRPWQILVSELQASTYPYARMMPPGMCSLKVACTDDLLLSRLLKAAGTARFSTKADLLQHDGIARGFDQAFYEHFFIGLGYKMNREPMVALARNLPLQKLFNLPDAVSRLAAFLGTAGLLPDASWERILPEYQATVRDLWSTWWHLGLPPLELSWCTGSTRPMNRPERRLLAGITFLEKTGSRPGRWLLDWIAGIDDPAELRRKLLASLEVETPWASFLGFQAKLAKPAQLLGLSRRCDLVVNVILPYLYALGRHTGNAKLSQLAVDTFTAFPKLQSNRHLVEIAHRILVPPSRLRDVAHYASEQQGLLEIHRDFCLKFNYKCGNCPLVQSDATARG